MAQRVPVAASRRGSSRTPGSAGGASRIDHGFLGPGRRCHLLPALWAVLVSASAPVEQWLAAQAAGDCAGFVDGRRGGIGVAEAREVLGVVEQAMGEVVGGALLAQAVMAAANAAAAAWSPSWAASRARTRSRSARSMGARCPGWLGVEQREQFDGAGAVPELVGGAGGQWPRPAQAFETYPERVCMIRAWHGRGAEHSPADGGRRR